ncbi:uncharacterized protein TEOVI_000271800 [Trypanosoma equiperdum]|uniref:Uncharacterized protein n=1 Tax=Trypanosoma equiperdum TaxID=5694 RepID=A0A1G4IG42_TRYEQ|nr:hypothetical protein, conserved [Trypanosoma equiperdum]
MESGKNAHRLNRIFRKPKTMVAPRAWRPAADGEGERQQPFSGVSLQRINAMISKLSEEERTRALAQQDPPTVVQEELAKRAARFGLTIERADAGNNEKTASSEITPEVQAVFQRRMERFGQSAAEEAMQKRVARFGNAATSAEGPGVELKLSEADREAMQRRQSRFGG